MGVGISAVTGGGTYEYGANVSIDATVKNGYTWSNWRHTVTGGAQVSTTKNYAFVMPASDQDYTAVATLDTYTITYNLDGGSHGTTHPSSYTVITSDITLSNPTKTGYTFAGWRVTTAPTAWGTGSSASGSTNFKIATGTYGNIAFEATWVADVYTITLSDGTGTSQSGAPSPIYLKYNDGWYNDSAATTSISTLTTTPIKVGYLFEGYYTNSDGTGTQIIDNVGTIVAGNTAFAANSTIYAKWTAQTGFCVTTVSTMAANQEFVFYISAKGRFYVDWVMVKFYR